jgi:hypothetical protein
MVKQEDKGTVPSAGPKAKLPEAAKRPTLVEIAGKWNEIIDKVDEVRALWADYTELYAGNRDIVDQSCSPIFQQIVHRQTNFSFFLEYLERYVRGGFEQLKIKE